MRSSSSDDAVRCRHGRPASLAPPGAQADTPILYLCFWCEGADGHSRNAQSLADLRSVDIRDFLARPSAFKLEAERRILDRASEAAKHFGKRAAAVAEHFRVAFGALCELLRCRAGGRERSLPYVTSLESYVAFLERAHVADTTWSTMPDAERSIAFVSAWGAALPALGMFRTPDLLPLIGVPVRPEDTVPRKDQREPWLRALEGLLSENLDAAADHEALREAIAGNETVESQLAKLGSKYLLSRDDPKKAHAALLRYLHEGDESAFTAIDWLFRKDPANKRSETQGLRAVLTARRAGRRRTSPTETAVSATEAALRSTTPAGSSLEALDLLIERLRRELVAPSARPGVSRALFDLVSSAVGGTPVGDPTWLPDFKAALGQVAMDPARARAAADAWTRLAKKPDEPVVGAPTVLLGVARLLAKLASDGEGDPVRVPNADGRTLLLRAAAVPDKKKPPEHHLDPRRFDDEARDALRAWLRDEVFPRPCPDDEGAVDEEGEYGEGGTPAAIEPPSLELWLSAADGKPEALLGEIELAWLAETQSMLRSTRTDVARAWSRPASAGRSHGVQARLAFENDGTPLAVPESIAEAIRELARSLGDPDAAWAEAFLTAPIGIAARAFVREWFSVLALAGEDPAAKLKSLQTRIQEAFASGNIAVAQGLIAEAAHPVKPALTVKHARALLEASTGVLRGAGAVPKALALAPMHPLVLRARAIADDVLAGVIAKIWTDGWPRAGLGDLESFLDDFGMPAPIHTYGGFWDGDPLVFDGWRDDGRSALFIQRAEASGSDVASLGVRRAIDEIRRYLRLYPAAADRLRIRIYGDDQLAWPKTFARALVESLSSVTADVDVVVQHGTVRSMLLERWVDESEALAQAVVIGEDGSRPRLRIRLTEATTAPVHITIVVAPTHPLFQGRLETVGPVAAVDTDPIDLRTAFSAERPVWTDNALLVGMPQTSSELHVAKAVASTVRGANGVAVERYSFDAYVLASPITDLHAHAHWLVLLGREPLHRALDTAGPDAVVLLDFSETRDRGRPLHVVTSVGRAQFSADLARLDALLREVIGEEIDAEALLRAARRFAPGLAIQCVATGSKIGLYGLTGLLLTGTWVRRSVQPDAAPKVALALDQCRSILGEGNSDRRADVLIVRSGKSAIELALAESKFTTGPLDAAQGVIADAVRQLADTRSRLARLCVDHPLRTFARAELRAALAYQAEAGNTAAEFLLHRIEREDAPIALAPANESFVCVFSPSSAGAPAFEVGAEEPRVVAFGRAGVLELLRETALVGRSVG